jgi:hypothetical protein
MRGYDQPKGLQATEIFGLQVPMTGNDRAAFAGHMTLRVYRCISDPIPQLRGKPDGVVVGRNRRD